MGFGPASYTVASTPGLVADVQVWLQTPAQNPGWTLIGDEQSLQSAKRLTRRHVDPATARATLDSSSAWLLRHI